MMKKAIRAIALAGLVFLAGCSGSYSRGQFGGMVVGSTQEQIVSRVGNPDETDSKDANRVLLVYKKRTFDPDNQNQVDQRTTVILERDSQGRLVGRDVIYS